MPAGPSITDEVRAHCAAVAARARWVTIDPGAAAYETGTAGLDPGLHFLDAPPEEVARYVLVLDAINFGSGWFEELGTGTNAITERLSAHAAGRGGPWTAAELRGLTASETGRVLGLPGEHGLTGIYTRALKALGAWLGDRTALDAVASADGSAERLAAQLAAGMPFYADTGFYKRAQITANDLALAGVAAFRDLDRLTVFADNLLPHVLRVDGVLRYAPELARIVDEGRELPAGDPMEVELRACAVQACELLAARAGVPARTLDNWLWNRGLTPPYSDGRPHRTRTVFY
jgi:hypothetical protein